MAIFHLSIKIVSRSSGKGAVAAAAYRAGVKLEEKETGYTHDYTRKRGVIYSEIFLPANAPQEYQNREILWNEVQKVEKKSDAQLAREIEVALPVELSREEQIKISLPLECVRIWQFTKSMWMGKQFCTKIPTPISC